MLFWRGVGAGVDFVTGYIAILMAETEPLMQAYYLLSNPGGSGCGVGTIVRGSGVVLML